MTPCSKVEEETNKKGASKKNCSALEAMHVLLNWEHIFSLPNETSQHMVAALQHPEIYVERVNGALKCQKHLSNVPFVTRLSLHPCGRRVTSQYHAKVHNARPMHYN